jgi:uncharacterized membrane protein
MKRIIQFLLFVIIVVFVYMLVVGIRQEMNKQEKDDLPIIEQFENEDTNS